MPTTPTPRLGLVAPTGGDPADVPTVLRTVTDRLEQVAVGYEQGATLPGHGSAGRLFYDTTSRTLYYDFGGGWIPFGWQPGDIRLSAADISSPPVGWLRTDGTNVLRTDYPALFDAVGYLYSGGVVPEAGKFRLPLYDGYALVGAGNAFPSAPIPRSERRLGQVWGRERHTLVNGEMPWHNHGGVTGSTAVELPITSARPNWCYVTREQPSYRAADGNQQFTYHSHGITPDGGSLPHDNMQPSAAVFVWIKT